MLVCNGFMASRCRTRGKSQLAVQDCLCRAHCQFDIIDMRRNTFAQYQLYRGSPGESFVIVKCLLDPCLQRIEHLYLRMTCTFALQSVSRSEIARTDPQLLKARLRQAA
jgi:hypothetical protein